MDMKEKLAELLVEFVEVDVWDNGEFIEKDIDFQKIASDLIAHGVTVQSEIDANTFQLMREIARLKEEKERFANAVNVLEEINSDLRKRIKGVTVQEWIPASEPPKDDLTVLVTCGKGYRPFVARYDLIRKRWKVSHTLKITHWQPLPSTRNLPQPTK